MKGGWRKLRGEDPQWCNSYSTQNVRFHWYSEIQESEMDGICSAHGRDVDTKLWPENLMERDQLIGVKKK